MIRLQSTPISVDEAIKQVENDAAGAIDIFVGTVRNQTKGKVVTHLEFEAYETMAISELEKIKAQAIEKWPVLNLAIYHAVGRLEIGEVPVVIAVSTAHRQAAFEACKFIIDTLKETVPIWKREFYEDGSVWVSAHP